MNKIIFLGTGDAMGVPRVYCDCHVCAEARTTARNRRYRSSILWTTASAELWIDCGPDWTHQMNMLHKRQLVHTLITHAHFDHIGGLPEWADACRWLNVHGHLYAPQEVIRTISGQFPWLSQFIHYHEIDGGLEFHQWHIVPWKVNHGKNGFSYAYRFSNPHYRWAYCPDSIHLTEEQKEPLRQLDLLVLGTSFYKESAETKTRSVYDMIEATELVGELRPQRVIFTHMSHDVDVTRDYPLPPCVQLAYTGMETELCK